MPPHLCQSGSDFPLAPESTLLALPAASSKPAEPVKPKRKTSGEIYSAAERMENLAHAVYKIEVATDDIKVAREAIAKLQRSRPLSDEEIEVLCDAGEELSQHHVALAEDVARASERNAEQRSEKNLLGLLRVLAAVVAPR